MNIEKFIKSVQESLGRDVFEKSGKKKSIKIHLTKLESRKAKLLKKLEKSDDKKGTKALKEELSIINVQIKKSKVALEKLSSENKKAD